MTEDTPDSHSRPPRKHARIALVAAGAVAAVLVIVAAVLVWPRPSVAPAPPDAATPSADASDEGVYRLPASEGALRPALHLTPEQNWMNDPQKPFLLDGVWHYYYLYNADYPDGNGTEWFHATSTDLIHWTDQGVAIEKYKNGLGDIWTGTAVVDHDNTAGFGAGAVVAIVTQQADGIQRQSLFVSHDGGYSFEPFSGNPVMENPGTRDFRDPRVLWDAERGNWVMALAEGGKIGFYTSPDLKAWTYSSGFETSGLGVLECPDLFPMAVDGNPDDVRWVLISGANGSAEGMTTGTVYWVGDWDGKSFTPHHAEHQWMDRGADFYAAVTWDDPRLTAEERLNERHAIGWLNNWAYAGQVPGDDWHGGSDSIVRTVRMTTRDGVATLLSEPIDEMNQLAGPAQSVSEAEVAPNAPVDLPAPDADAYRIVVEISAPGGDAELRLQIPRGDGAFATVGYDFSGQTAFAVRDQDAIASTMASAYREPRTAQIPTHDGVVRLDVIVDNGSVEAFVNDGEASLSMVTGSGSTASQGLRAAAARGAVTIHEATITPLRVAPVERMQ
ncbi:glycoside hydrolase family 32 protein [Microbacterium saccharophilum]|uniref:Glycoside hydrolase family 32 protein n=1 Tax=Microbacterium saccharophilum TaxID=1213358 RepID=A0A5C8I6R7_9MICO|nr:glycoside hydrolase family 32 protein [Microbacterium saccharophilum]TXK13910.1 glycoside hydrolase family 32 protein [Microbacterium saccharophilum]GEP48953.1 levanbiose-producing levanase [Microbacterium saccharophilum]